MPKTFSPNRTRALTLTGLMTAVLCILGPFSIPLPVSPVPLSLTNFVVYLTVYLLGMKSGTVSILLYLLLGAAGLPVFSGFAGGLGKLAGPTGGYLIGFLFVALIQGFLMERFPGKRPADIAGMVSGLAVCYAFGTLWLDWQMHLTPAAALAAGVIPYLPGDAVKIFIAAVVGPKLKARIRKV
ncbi:MAG TPA: biotin transporter BioY [Candidatus Mediterraneibacter norfolkensis]|nr:biotin transporter BioY [Candidatus Mediterraneibacter norfolkensis]